jgi:hypothetical protein
MTAHVRVWVGGTGSSSEVTGSALEGFNISGGRTDPRSPIPDPAALLVQYTIDTGDTLPTLGAEVYASGWLPDGAGGTTDGRPIFYGHITDISVERYNQDPDRILVSLLCADPTAKLAGLIGTIGSQTQEDIGDRWDAIAGEICALLGSPSWCNLDGLWPPSISFDLEARDLDYNNLYDLLEQLLLTGDYSLTFDLLDGSWDATDPSTWGPQFALVSNIPPAAALAAAITGEVTGDSLTVPAGVATGDVLYLSIVYDDGTLTAEPGSGFPTADNTDYYLDPDMSVSLYPGFAHDGRASYDFTATNARIYYAFIPDVDTATEESIRWVGLYPPTAGNPMTWGELASTTPDATARLVCWWSALDDVNNDVLHGIEVLTPASDYYQVTGTDWPVTYTRLWPGNNFTSTPYDYHWTTGGYWIHE